MQHVTFCFSLSLSLFRLSCVPELFLPFDFRVILFLNLYLLVVFVFSREPPSFLFFTAVLCTFLGCLVRRTIPRFNFR